VRIGVDLDGIIFDYVGEVLRRWNAEFDASFEETDMTDYEIWKSLGVSKQTYMEWYEGEVVEEGLLVDLPPYPDAETFLWELLGPIEELDILPNDIIFLTARDCQYSAADTSWALEQLDFPFKELHFCEAKWRVDCDVYIDDNPHLLHRFKKLNKELMLLERPWTQHIEGTFPTYNSIVTYLDTKVKRMYDNGY